MVEDGPLGQSKTDSQPAIDDSSASSSQPASRILEEVLQKTIRESFDALGSQDDIACLRVVAEKHSGKGLDVPSVLQDLVHAMLVRIFDRPDDGNWDKMANTISDSLLEDPTALLRVEKLWKRLSSVNG